MRPTTFPIDAERWLRSFETTLLTPAEEGALIRLLCRAWLTEDCGLPDDPALLAQLSRLGAEGWAATGPKIMAAGFVKGGGLIWNEAQRAERARLQERSQLAKKSSECRWGPPRIDAGRRNGIRLESERTLSCIDGKPSERLYAMPEWLEFWDYCQLQGGPSEPYAHAAWREADGTVEWHAYAEKVMLGWLALGRPGGPL